MTSKAAAAQRLIEWHFEVEPELREVYLFVSDNGEPQDAPIQLLEVNAATVSTGTVEPFTFAPTEDIPFKTVIAEVTPAELEELRSKPEALPRGWSFSRARRFSRPQPA